MAFLCVVRLMDLHDCVKCIYTIVCDPMVELRLSSLMDQWYLCHYVLRRISGIYVVMY